MIPLFSTFYASFMDRLCSNEEKMAFIWSRRWQICCAAAMDFVRIGSAVPTKKRKNLNIE
jgi:hypothetical protein